jgi:hypothetical protein
VTASAGALDGIVQLVLDVVAGFADGESVPEPLMDRQYSGELRVRIPPAVHRRLALVREARTLVVTADHAAVVTDPNDVVDVQAKVADNGGNLIANADNRVTFNVSGPGTIVAVDSGSVLNESFRGNARNAFQGLAFAIVRATGPGTITVAAATPGLNGSSASIESREGAFVPCSGSCD